MWAKDGYTEEQMAKKLGISKASFTAYKKKYPNFLASIKVNREVADYKIEQVLYEQALAGDMKAIVFWLRNRNPSKWNRKENPEIELLPLKKLELETKIAILERDLKGEETEQYEDDGFIDAVSNAANDVWGDGDD